MESLYATTDKDKLVMNDEAERHFDTAWRALRRAVDAQLGADASFDLRERTMLELSNEAGRQILEQDLQQVADRYQAESLFIAKQPYRRHSEATVTYHSLCGSLQVTRWLYRRDLKRNDKTAVPMELAACIIERATPALAYRVALGHAQCPGRQWMLQVEASHRRTPSRSTLERMAKAIGTQAKQQTPAIEPMVRSIERLPQSVCAISLGLDRTTVPMQEERDEDLPPDPSRRRRTKPYVRTRPPPIDVNYRMAYVGTVSFLDAHGEAVKTLRYAASAQQGPGNILKSIAADVAHAMSQCKRSRRAPLTLGIVQDGAPEMWSLLRGALSARGFGQPLLEAIDWHHLVERLAVTLDLLPKQKVERQRTLRRWRHELLRDDHAIDRIERYIQHELSCYADNCARAHRQVRIDNAMQIKSHLTYIRNNKSRMRYKTMRDAGMPVGSGATEGACKSTISVRAKGCGQRWKQQGIDAALTLRSHYMSDRLPAFWRVFSHCYRDEIVQAA